MTDIAYYTALAYRIFENRDEIEYLAGRLKPYKDMLAKDAPDLLPRMQTLFHKMFPEAAMVPARYDIRWIQESLNKLGEHLHVDGINGDATKAAVERFQAQHGLEADGWVGFQTGSVLETLTRGVA
jgi:murein L,D-transpeptidase YcbB/YkuD